MAQEFYAKLPSPHPVRLIQCRPRALPGIQNTNGKPFTIFYFETRDTITISEHRCNYFRFHGPSSMPWRHLCRGECRAASVLQKHSQ